MCLGVADWYRPDGKMSAKSIAKRYVDFALRLATVAPAPLANVGDSVPYEIKQES
jgi:hypothetical protein